MQTRVEEVLKNSKELAGALLQNMRADAVWSSSLCLSLVSSLFTWLGGVGGGVMALMGVKTGVVGRMAGSVFIGTKLNQT